MRSQEEIVQRYEERKADDMLGFEVQEYLGYLDYEHVKPYLKEGTKKKDWESLKFEELLASMKDYMSFAFEKAYGERGISANRSVMHYIAWIWLNGDEFYKEIEKEFDNNYHSYGIPILIEICHHYDWEIPTD